MRKRQQMGILWTMIDKIFSRILHREIDQRHPGGKGHPGSGGGFGRRRRLGLLGKLALGRPPLALGILPLERGVDRAAVESEHPALDDGFLRILPPPRGTRHGDGGMCDGGRRRTGECRGGGRRTARVRPSLERGRLHAVDDDGGIEYDLDAHTWHNVPELRHMMHRWWDVDVSYIQHWHTSLLH